MTASELHPEGWISVPVAENFELRAKAVRAERDRLYGNIYQEQDTDARWVGDLGEHVFDSWFKHNKIAGYNWIQEDSAGAPDFVTSLGVRIGVKTVKRKVPPRGHYTAQITAQHAQEPTEQFFFMSYEINRKIMWLLGGVDKQTFLTHAVYHEGGQQGGQVHSSYTVREGHKIYNIAISKLMKPMDWLNQMN